MYLKIQQKLHCLGCISKQTMRSVVKKTRLNPSKDDFLMKASLTPQKESWAFFWTFSFHFLSFNSVFLNLKCRTLVLQLLHGDLVAAMCLKWISATKVSKYGKREYSRALNASYTFQPLWVSGFMEVMNTRQKISFSFCELRYSPLESIPESFPTLEKLNEIWKEEWGLEQRLFKFE